MAPSRDLISPLLITSTGIAAIAFVVSFGFSAYTNTSFPRVPLGLFYKSTPSKSPTPLYPSQAASNYLSFQTRITPIPDTAAKMLGMMEDVLSEISEEIMDEKGGLPPGFRFHPTDEELITFYLASKVFNGSFCGIPIAEIDLNRCEPWELPGMYVVRIAYGINHFHSLGPFKSSIVSTFHKSGILWRLLN